MERLKILVKWAIALGLSGFLVPAAVLGAPIITALKSDWIYFYKYNQPLGCFPSDSAAAEAVIANADSGSSYVCNARFSQWTTAWPEGEGITSYFRTCPPAGIPFTWGVQHMEDRDGKYAHEPYCTSPTDEISLTITRHFFYYCPDNYELFTPPHEGGPAIPYCRLIDLQTDTDKQPPSECPKQGVPSCGNPFDVGTGNKFQRETDYQGRGYSPLVFSRYYNSKGGGDGSLGANWTHTYSRSIERIDLTLTSSLARVHRPDGRILTFDNMSGSWKAQPDIWAETGFPDTLFGCDDATGGVLWGSGPSAASSSWKPCAWCAIAV